MEVLSFTMWMGWPGAMTYGLDYLSVLPTLLNVQAVFLLADGNFDSRSLQMMKRIIPVPKSVAS